MPLTMYDSVTIGEIPSNAKAVAGYVGGRYRTFPALEQLFPKAHKLSIAVASTQDAECLDVEPGDAPPQLAAAWVKRQLGRGVKRPVVYTSVSGAQQLVGLLARGGIKRSQVRLWTAHYTGKPHRCGPACGYGLRTFADATQYTDKALGRNLDASLCVDSFFGSPVDPQMQRWQAILAQLRKAAKLAGGWRKVPLIWKAARRLRAAIKRRSQK